VIAKYATVTLNAIQYTVTPSPYTSAQVQSLTASYYTNNINTRIATMNIRLKQLGYEWTVCAQQNSSLSYAVKRNYFGYGNDNYNNYSAEHYCGGPLDFPPLSISSSSTGLKSTAVPPSSWDWRKRHGAMDNTSPYYNFTVGCSGWINQRRFQHQQNDPFLKCGSCVIFAAVAMIENGMSLYYNRYIDYDLSEQSILSCNNDGRTECNPNNGAFHFPTAQLTDSGLVKESCYKYQAKWLPCHCKYDSLNRCQDKELLKINKYFFNSDLIYGTDTVKKCLVKNGPMYMAVSNHAILLVGWRTSSISGSTIWLVKNSDAPDYPDGITEYGEDELVYASSISPNAANPRVNYIQTTVTTSPITKTDIISSNPSWTGGAPVIFTGNIVFTAPKVVSFLLLYFLQTQN